MGKKQRDCAGCGAPVGIIGREHCCRCRRKIREAAAKAECPGCGKQRVLQDETGRCVLCSRCCRECGHPVRRTEDTLCRDCRRKARQAAAQRPCPRCGRPGYLREATGWCGPCSRPRQPKDPPRECAQCGQVKRHAGLGMCSACLQRRPDRAFVAGAGLAARLASPPDWLDGFIAHLAGGLLARPGPATLITALGRLLDEDGQPAHPQALLERARWPGRSMGPLARGLETFFTAHGLALPTDHAEQLAAGRRQRRIDAVPGAAAPGRGRVRRARCSPPASAPAGPAPGRGPTTPSRRPWRPCATWRCSSPPSGASRTGHWPTCTTSRRSSATLPRARKRRLTVLRQFFRFARSRKVILADPTRGLAAREPRGFTGQTLPLDKQRELFRRWTTGRDAHPHEALLGILALLHGASSHEVRHLRVDDIDETARTARLGSRPRPVPLDPASWQVLQRCLAHREAQRTANPHVIVTKGTKAGRSPASTAYVSHLLDACGVPPRAAALHPPRGPGQHDRPQARRRRVRHEARGRHVLPRRPRRRRAAA